MEKGEFYLNHALKASNVHVGLNKDKILLVLYSSKTHAQESAPQKIKIESIGRKKFTQVKPTTATDVKKVQNSFAHFCPFVHIRKYMLLRGTYENENEQFFIFKSKIPVTPGNICSTLCQMITRLGLDSSLYDFHSFRAGRTSDLVKMGCTIEQVKGLG